MLSMNNDVKLEFSLHEFFSSSYAHQVWVGFSLCSYLVLLTELVEFIERNNYARSFFFWIYHFCNVVKLIAGMYRNILE